MVISNNLNAKTSTTSLANNILSPNKNITDLINTFEVKNRKKIFDKNCSTYKIRKENADDEDSNEHCIQYSPNGHTLRIISSTHNISSFCEMDGENDEFFDEYNNSQFDCGNVVKNPLSEFRGRLHRILSFIPIPGISATGMGIIFLLTLFITPKKISENLLFPAFRLIFGTLYPAYASYKAVRTKNVKEYVKWMMYWIVFAFFTCIETFTDIFLSWFPFYYEVKVIIVLWLLSPATKGSSTLYRKFVHPMLTRREQEIDEYISQAKEKGYSAVLQLGSKGVNYATNVIMQTALKGGGNLVQTIRRSYSLSDLSEPDVHMAPDEIDEVSRPQRLLRTRTQTARSSSGGRHVDMYFSEVDVDPKSATSNYNYIRSSEDISSGYSSAEPIPGGLSRTSSMTNASRTRLKGRKAEDNHLLLENDEFEATQIDGHILNSQPENVIYCRKPNLVYGSSPESINLYTNSGDNKQKYSGSTENVRSSDFDGNMYADLFEMAARSKILDTKEKPQLHAKDLSNYEMFCKWLEDTDKYKKEQKEEFNPVEPQRMPESGVAVNSESDDDSFADADDTEIILNESLKGKISADSTSLEIKDNSETITNLNIELKSDLTDTNITHNSENIIDANSTKPITSDELEPKQFNDDKLLSTEMESCASTSRNSSNTNLSSETSFSKRFPVHNKGRAPEPPKFNTSTTEFRKSLPISTNQLFEEKFPSSISLIDSMSKMENLPALGLGYNLPQTSILPLMSASVNDLTTSTLTNENTKRSKRSLFRSYLPAIFRPESPKPNPPDDYPKETQI